MKKSGSLRGVIVAAAPAFKQNPDKLLVFIDKGKIVSTSTKSLSFEYHYTLNLILTDYAGDPDQIMIAVLAWAKINQPNLVARDDLPGITFEVDHLTNETVDMSIVLQLTEAVIVQTNPDGTHNVRHGDEPVPEWFGNSLAPQ